MTLFEHNKPHYIGQIYNKLRRKEQRQEYNSNWPAQPGDPRD